MGTASRRLFAPVAVLVLACATGGDPAPQANPAAAIAEAAGHPARAHVHAEAAQTEDGEHVTVSLDVAGDQRLERMCSANLCSGSWFDGHREQRFGVNGTPFAERGADDGAERTYAAIASTGFAEPDFNARGGMVAAEPATGAEQRYRVRAPGGAELVAVADRHSAELLRIERPDGSPFRRLVATRDTGTTLYAGRRFDVLQRTDEPLTAPSGPAVTITGTQTVAIVSDRLPVVPCTLAGRRATCLIDSGTTPSAVTLELAEELDLEPHGRIEIAGLDSYLTGAIEAGPLVIGGATFAPMHFAVIPHVKAAGFDVILGSDVLAAIRIAFKAGPEQVELGAPQSPAAGESNLVFAGGVPFAQVRLGSSSAAAMLVDTGDSAPLSIGYDQYRRDPGLFAARGAAWASGAGWAALDAVQGVIDHAEVAGTPFAGLAIDAVRGQHGGHVGYGMRAYCRPFVVDLSAARLDCGTATPGSAPPQGKSER